MLAGFVGGGGNWFIETQGANRLDSWESRWQVGDRERPDKRIWRVNYLRIRSGVPPQRSPSDDLEQLKTEFRHVLEAIAEFSRSQNLTPFTQAFECSLARLESPAPLDGLHHADIAPPNFLPLTANQLLGAAETAWVFGAMGSWNDLGFQGEIQAQYEEVSEKLYRLLNRVIVAAANSRANP